ncbi:hypothetical protein PRN20_06090 [Devosia sp. ZB163]|uniref:hypothetical protein n=1 Tax=Devosia sp. ZB163 TaxID=3025938 RepID=UPI00235E1B6D|nr:hypothetical protein [Devosia sp. ZB163]MDC9823294.1 hypothetical protein [Devosia sp. ZB163]
MKLRVHAPASESDPLMPVDHPTPPPGAVRPVRARLLFLTLSFLVTLGAMLAIAPLLRQANMLG